MVVWWPKHVGGKKWEGHLVNGKYIYRKYAQSVVSFILRDVIFLLERKALIATIICKVCKMSVY